MRPIFWLALLLTAQCTRARNDASGSPAPVSTPEDSARPVDTAGPPAARPTASANSEPTLSGPAWTAGIVDKKSARAGVATLLTLRVATHDGFDRVVFEFDPGALPSLHVEYIDRPVRRCGSGEATEIEGDAWLSVLFEPARAHTDAGLPTAAPRERFPKLPVVREIELTCDFEAQLVFVLGASRPGRYRVFELDAPSRLVLDIRH